MTPLYFPESRRIRAYYLFSLIIQFVDCIRYLMPFLIGRLQWRNTWIAMGLLGVLNAILIMFSTPDLQRVIQKDLAKKEKEMFKSMHQSVRKATKTSKIQASNAALNVSLTEEDESQESEKSEEVRQTCCQLFGELLAKYKKHFGLMFSNYAAVMMLIGSLLRLMQTSIASLYYQKWFTNYGNDFDKFSALSAVGSLIGGPTSTFITGFFVDMFGAKSEMTIPIICIVKSVIDVPLQYMIFG